MKKTLLLILVLLLAIPMAVWAETTVVSDTVAVKDLLMENAPAMQSVNDFSTESEYPYETVGYFLDDVVFLDENTLEVTITFTGDYGSNEYFFSNCYIPIYNYETEKLLDVFYSDVELKKPFATSSRTSITRQITLDNVDVNIFKLKVFMLESLTSLRPNCPVPYRANELVIAKNDISGGGNTGDNETPGTGDDNGSAEEPTEQTATVTFSTSLLNAPLNKSAQTLSFAYVKNIVLSDKAVDLGYTKDDFSQGFSLQVTPADVIPYVGLICDFVVDITDELSFKLVSVTPREGYNTTVTVKPNLIVNMDNAGYMEYYPTNDATKTEQLKLDVVSMHTYINYAYQSGGYTSVSVHTNDTAWNYVDTDNDGDYDTLLIEREEVFSVGVVNATSNRITRETANANAMSTLIGSASIVLDPDDDYINWSLKDSAGNAMEISDVQVGDVAVLKRSTDTDATFYDITIYRDTVEGVVTEVYSEIDKVTGYMITKYVMNGETYEMLTYPNDMPYLGDSLIAQVYNGKIVCFEIELNINYGMIIANNVASDFTTTYQVQVMNQNGEVITYNLADKVNGADYSSYNFETEFPKGAIIAYELNADGEISKADVYNPSATGYSYSVDNTLNGGVLGNTLDVAAGKRTYNASTKKIGSYYVTDSTVVLSTQPSLVAISYLTAKTINKDSIEILEDDIDYEFVAIYNDAKEVQFIVLYEAANVINYNNYPMIVTEKRAVLVDGDSRIKYIGYVNGEKKEFVVAADPDGAAASLNVNDIAMYRLNSKGELAIAVKLASYNNKTYTVVENYTVTLDEDNTYFVQAVETTLNGNANVALANQVTRNVSAAANLKGYAYSGKAYNVVGNNLIMINDYYATECTVDGYAIPYGYGEAKNYDTATATDGLLEDLTVDSSVVAYYFNAKTNTVSLATLGDLETDVNTGVYRANDTDNDDMVYIYNYDGQTKLILIIDPQGDNGL